tara:strand:- start:2320 stop:6636 length:4317 start_codon:yes stop_codon:yes gene_type:complete
MTRSGIDNLYLSQTGAYIYASDAYDSITGNTGAGGLYAGSGFTGVYKVFNAAVISGGDQNFPTGAPTTSSIYFAPTVVIGASGQEQRDVRGEGTGYSGVTSTGNLTGLLAGTAYSGTLYAVYTGGGGKHLTGRVGIGVTTSPTEYYRTTFKTLDFFEFNDTYSMDTGDLAVTGSGSGVYLSPSDVRLDFDIINRQGASLVTTPALQQDSFFDQINISILDEDGDITAANYHKNYQHASFSFPLQDNTNVFGAYRRNFGIQTVIVDQNTQTQTSKIQLRANHLDIDNITVRDADGLFIDENTGNFVAPNTGLTGALPFTNRQLLNPTGATGYISMQFAFKQNPEYTMYKDVGIWAATSGNFTTNPDNFLGRFPIDQSQAGQLIYLYPDNGVPLNTGLYFQIQPGSMVGAGPIFHNGPYTLRPHIRPEDPALYDVGEQVIRSGNLYISGQGAGGLFAYGASGTGDGNRLTGPGNVPYVLSGDSPSEADTLQTVASRGNTTTTNITVGASATPTKTLDVRGTTLLSGNSSVSGTLEVNNDFTVTSGPSKLIDTSISSNKIVFGGLIADATTNAPYEVFYDKAIISATNSNIYSVASVIVGGSGHTISGDFDVIAGGATNNISGGNFNFIGGGTGIDIKQSAWTSSLGGQNNDVESASQSVIGGGINNSIKNTESAALLGGISNTITGNGWGFIGGGENNTVTGSHGSVLGGENNGAYGYQSSVAGGGSNEAHGRYSFVGGGQYNLTSGNNSFCLGRQVRIASAHSGAAVLADGQERDHLSSGAYTLSLDFVNGVYIPSGGLYISGNPVMTGTHTVEADTLQTVTDRGATTTNTVAITNSLIVDTGTLFVNSTGKKVGIGVTGAANKLDVHGSVIIGGGSYAGTTTAPSNGLVVEGAVGIGSTNPNTSSQFSVHGSGSFGRNYFSSYTAPSDGLIVEGSVGIGTYTAASKLDVNGNVSIGSSVMGYAGPSNGLAVAGNVGIGTYSANNALDIYGATLIGANYSSAGATAPSNGLIVEGNVGVGTSSPKTALDVRGTVSGYTGLFPSGVGIGTSTLPELLSIAPNTDVSAEIGRAHVGYIGHSDYAGFSHIDKNTTTSYALLQQSNGATYLNAANGTNIYFRMNNSGIGGFNSSSDFYVDTDTLYVDASEDRVGINESSPSYTLDVTASDASSLLSRFYNTSSTNGQGLLIRAGETANANRILQCASRNDTKIMTVNSNGSVGVGTDSPYGRFDIVSSRNAENDLSDADNYHLHLHNNGDDTDESVGIGFGITSDTDAIGACIGHERKGALSFGDLFFATRPTGGSVTERVRIASDGNVGIGTNAPANALDVVGHFSATSKSFVIDHPTKENKKLQYGSLEGPEHGVFIRGTTNKNVIKLPDYWKDLVHEDSITVTLTPVHSFQSLYVKSKTPEQIVIGGVKKSYDYVVYGERKDVDKLEVEI